MAKRRATRRRVVEEDDLLGLDKKTLAGLVASQVGGLPYHRQKGWASRHLPATPAREARERPRATSLLRDIETFCANSRAGAYVSWSDDHGWYNDDEDAGEGFDDWTELFTDLMKGALELTRSGRHAVAVDAYRKLLGLLHAAGETTDILGDHGAPEDSVRVELAMA